MYFGQKFLLKVILSLIRKGNAQKALRLAEYLKIPEERDYYKGICSFELGNLAEAQKYLENALVLMSTDEALVQILAQVYMLQKKWNAAVKILAPLKKHSETRRLMEIINNGEDSRQDYINYTNLIKKAMKTVQEKKYEDTVICLKNALQYTPYDDGKAKIYNQIGAVYFNYIKDRAKAEEFFSRAYQILPNDKRIKMNYAKAKLS